MIVGLIVVGFLGGTGTGICIDVGWQGIALIFGIAPPTPDQQQGLVMLGAPIGVIIALVLGAIAAATSTSVR